MFKLNMTGKELHEYHTRINRMRKFTTSFMKGWIIGVFLGYLYFLLIGKTGTVYALTFAGIMSLVGYICTYSGYFIIRFLVWNEYRKKSQTQ